MSRGSRFKKFKNRKGLTLVEAIVAMTVLGMLSTVVLVMFTNSMVAVKLANDRIEINALTRVIKENVVTSVKNGVGNTLISFDKDSSNHEYVIDLKSVPNLIGTPNIIKNFKIIDEKGIINTRYMFDAVRVVDFIPASDPGYSTADSPNTCEYLITIKKIFDNSVVQKLRLDINNTD
jgi:prepilin-type N-terminal cleavage/methylation domain-containing protein